MRSDRVQSCGAWLVGSLTPREVFSLVAISVSLGAMSNLPLVQQLMLTEPWATLFAGILSSGFYLLLRFGIGRWYQPLQHGNRAVVLAITVLGISVALPITAALGLHYRSASLQSAVFVGGLALGTLNIVLFISAARWQQARSRAYAIPALLFAEAIAFGVVYWTGSQPYPDGWSILQFEANDGKPIVLSFVQALYLSVGTALTVGAVGIAPTNDFTISVLMLQVIGLLVFVYWVLQSGGPIFGPKPKSDCHDEKGDDAQDRAAHNVLTHPFGRLQHTHYIAPKRREMCVSFGRTAVAVVIGIAVGFLAARAQSIRQRWR